MKKRIPAEHGTVFSQPDSNLFGYFGWPSIAKTEDGTLYAGASGYRNSHVCPFGKTVLMQSRNEGRSWSSPAVIDDSPIDDRDVGLTALPGNRLLLSWFTSDTRHYFPEGESKPHEINFRPVLDSWEEETVRKNIGSLIRIRDEKGNWGKRQFVKVSAPHGAVRLKNGRLFYLGNSFAKTKEDGTLEFSMQYFCRLGIQAIASDDDGKTWSELGTIPKAPDPYLFCEPHVIERNNGEILAMIRYQGNGEFSIWQAVSGDGGRNWSTPVKITDGAPPHLMRHSNGVLICTYGYRRPGFGQRVMFSRDDGNTWSTDWILRDDGYSIDLGYPATVELSGGTLYTIYYQSPQADTHNCAILSSRWELPEEFQ